MLTEAQSFPSVSVVICTRNRPDTNEQAVDSVLANDFQHFDVTIIDQSTTTSTEERIRPRLGENPHLHYVHVEQPGLSRAYNVGIAGTSGEILAFTDDDCVAPRNWLSTIVQAFREDEQADLLYGQVLAPGSQTAEGSVTPALAIERPERLSRRDGFRVFGMGANFAARRRLFECVGGFDEILGGGAPLRSSQDYDLSYRSYVSGRAILLRPDVQVVHYGTRSSEEWPATLRAYGIGDGAFYFKHVRCFDLYALRLLAGQLLTHFFRHIAFRLRGRGPGNLTYVRFILVGIWQCLQFDVDRHSRLYSTRLR